MGNRFIYYILDWERPGLAIGTVCGCIVLVSCFCVLVFGLYRLRISIYESCSKKPEEIPATVIPPKEPAQVVWLKFCHSLGDSEKFGGGF